jgi:DNA-binding transcriptional MerR regulator
MRIGELANELGVSADTLRFYEKSGLLPGPERGENGYRDYGPADVERLRLVVELRRLDIPAPDAARMAGWCQTGHCLETSTELPEALAARRSAIAARIAGLRALDDRLAALEHHLSLAELPMAGSEGPCCTTAALVEQSAAVLTARGSA